MPGIRIGASCPASSVARIHSASPTTAAASETQYFFFLRIIAVRGVVSATVNSAFCAINFAEMTMRSSMSADLTTFSPVMT